MLKVKLYDWITFLIIIAFLCTSCAGKYGKTKAGAGIGAAIGCIGGWIIGGDFKDCLIGAAAGAAIGGLTGAYLDHRQTRDEEEVLRDYSQEESHVDIDYIKLSQDVLKYNDEATLNLGYTIVSPEGKQDIAETIEYYYNDSDYGTNTNNFKLQTGSYETSYPLKIIEGMPQGEYRIVATVSNGIQTDKHEKTFIVYASNHFDRKNLVALLK
jgi:hypothetical protein